MRLLQILPGFVDRSLGVVVALSTSGNPISAVCFSAMLHAGDGNCVFGWLLKEDAVIAATKTKSTLRWFELLHVSVPRAEIAADTVKDVESGAAVYCAEVSAGFRRP
jgi:hypothetical protein